LSTAFFDLSSKNFPYPKIFLVIPVVEVIGEGVASSTRNHLLGAACERVRVCPTPLGRLAIGLGDKGSEVEGEEDIACLDVRGQVEFGNEPTIISLRSLQAELQSVLGKALPDVLVPLGHNVIRDVELDNVVMVLEAFP
jgi:hypothetical protein